MRNIVEKLRSIRRMCLSWAYRPILRALPKVRLRLKVWRYRKFILPRLVERVSRKEKDRVNVVFLALNISMWRYDGVFRKLQADTRFNPVILTAMRTNESQDEQIADQNQMIEYFFAKGYKVIPGFDANAQKWLDLHDLAPDIVFYTQQYSIALAPQYNCDIVKEYALICFAPYSLTLVTEEHNYNLEIHNYAWFNFMVSRYYLDIGRKYSYIGCSNAVPVGYGVGEEIAAAMERCSRDTVWYKVDGRKKVIWAPHHTIGVCNGFQIGAFLEICDEMLRLRDEYRDSIVFAFKPHPMMLTKLYREWGKDRADAYYRNWAEGENSFLADGTYIDLFAQSDAMIHDSSSFIVEYIYTNKPVAYTYRKAWLAPSYNEIGTEALKVHYDLHDPSEIKGFFEDVVLAGKDTLESARRKFAKDFLNDGTGSFSENVVNEIRNGIRTGNG